MQNRRLRSQRDGLKSLLDRTDEAVGNDIDLIGHWGRYLCVLTAGFLENSLKEVYSDFVGRASSPKVTRFAATKLDDISNPKAGRFVETARSFDQAWAVELEAFLNEDDSRRKNAIDSIMNNRHQIAHGGSVQISVGRVREYLPGCIEVVEFLEDQVK